MPLSQTLPTVLFESQLLSRICICVPRPHYTVMAIDTGLCSKPYLFWHEISNRFCHYSDPLRLFSLIAGVIGTCCITHNFLGLIYQGMDIAAMGWEHPTAKNTYASCILVVVQEIKHASHHSRSTRWPTTHPCINLASHSPVDYRAFLYLWSRSIDDN